jgi:hypothetical protein
MGCNRVTDDLLSPDLDLNVEGEEEKKQTKRRPRASN